MTNYIKNIIGLLAVVSGAGGPTDADKIIPFDKSTMTDSIYPNGFCEFSNDCPIGDEFTCALYKIGNLHYKACVPRAFCGKEINDRIAEISFVY